MENGTSQTLVVKTIARVNETNITNIASVNCTEEEWNYTNNIDNATIKIVNIPVNKTSNVDSVYYGGSVDFSLSVTNLVNKTWDEIVTMVDSLPQGLEFVKVVSWENLEIISNDTSTQDVTFKVTNIPALSTGTIVIRVNCWIVGDVENPLTVTCPNFNTTVYKNITGKPIVDVATNKTSDKEEYFIDDTAIWTINVSNAANGTNATNVVLKDVFPSEFVFINYTATKGTYNARTGEWNIGFMGNGTYETLVIRSYARTVANGINNIVNVTCAEDDWNLSNNVANKTVNVVDLPDLKKTVNDPTPFYNDTVEYTLTIKNIANMTYTENLRVIDSLPNGLKYVKTVSISGAKLIKEVVNGQKITWTITNIAAKSSAVIKVKVKVLALGSLTNNLTIIGPRGTNKTVNCTIDPIPWADLAVIKTNDHYRIDCHNSTTVTWSIKVVNNGPNTAVNAIAKDILPEGIIYLSDDSNGKYDPNTGIWKIGNLAKGKSKTINIVTKVDATDVIIDNEVDVSSDTYDPNESNNHDNSSVKVIAVADLMLIKDSNVTKVYVGDKFSYTITVINNGPDRAVNARAYDVLPKGLKLVSFKASKGDYDPETGKWTIGDLENGEKVTLEIHVIACVAGKIINEARVESDTYDNDTSNNNDSVTVIVEEPTHGPPIKMLPTGNPLLIALLSLIAIVGVTLRRKI
jgi:uncharacterized repeat protein (TIGR01451 family)